MNATKIACAIVVAGLIIACGIYFGLTQERRDYMRSCEALSPYALDNPAAAELLCANQFNYKR